MNLITKAEKIMKKAHGQQKRKTDGSPYIIHPQMTAKKLADLGFSDTVVAAALVHDVLEDTDFPPEKLRAELGEKVFAIVKTLTENKSLPWEIRKAKYLRAVKKASEETKAVAIADKIHNLEDLITIHAQMGPTIWQKFNRGKNKKIWFENQMLKMFQETWNHPLIAEYAKLLKQAETLD